MIIIDFYDFIMYENIVNMLLYMIREVNNKYLYLIGFKFFFL